MKFLPAQVHHPVGLRVHEGGQPEAPSLPPTTEPLLLTAVHIGELPADDLDALARGAVIQVGVGSGGVAGVARVRGQEGPRLECRDP